MAAAAFADTASVSSANSAAAIFAPNASAVFELSFDKLRESLYMR